MLDYAQFQCDCTIISADLKFECRNPVFVQEWLLSLDGVWGKVETMSRTDIDLQIDFTGALTVKWTGRANDRRPAAALNPMFDKLIAMQRYLRFDFCELEHMASSTLVVLLKNFKKLQAMGIGFEFRYDDRVTWQRMTFAQLESFAAPQSTLLAA